MIIRVGEFKFLSFYIFFYQIELHNWIQLSMDKDLWYFFEEVSQLKGNMS